jgi:hypothetical protein
VAVIGQALEKPASQVVSITVLVIFEQPARASQRHTGITSLAH